MNETNNLFSATMAALGMALSGFYGHLAPWLMLGLVLVMVDLRFGLLAAKARSEEIRPSRALRRTLNKMVDYLCWVTLAEVCSRTFGITLGNPVVSMAIEYKGIKKKWNFFKLVGKEEMLEDSDTQSETDKSDNNGRTEDKSID